MTAREIARRVSALEGIALCALAIRVIPEHIAADPASMAAFAVMAEAEAPHGRVLLIRTGVPRADSPALDNRS